MRPSDRLLSINGPVSMQKDTYATSQVQTSSRKPFLEIHEADRLFHLLEEDVVDDVTV